MNSKETKTTLSVNMTVSFGDWYKENRHGTKKAKFIAIITFDSSNIHFKWEGYCFLMKDKSISWIFPADCPNNIQDDITNLYTSDEMLEVFSKLRKTKHLD